MSKPIVFQGLRRIGDGSPPAFEFTCECGASIRGQREKQPQVTACPACGAKRFVFPRSPLPEVAVSLDLPDPRASRQVAVWMWLAAAAMLLVVAIGIGAWLRHRVNSPGASERPLSDAEQLERHLSDGKSAIAGGDWHQAARELSAAIQLADRLPLADRKHLIQQQRQAAILADLLSESPAEIARQSLGLPEREWREIFHDRYAARSLILDDTVHRDASGQYHQDLKITLQNLEMKFDLASVKILRNLPLNQPQRVLIGIRLADIRRDAGGWTILLDPEGGVLMTDGAMLAGLSVPVDDALRGVLKRQQIWLGNFP
jgi:DNA-directed RNA polymerase subunit RPC12/RpoP